VARRPKKAFMTPNRIISVRIYKVQPHDQEHRFMKTAQYQTGRMLSLFPRISATLSKLAWLCTEEKKPHPRPLFSS
jgi:hypothetical protein